MDITIRPMRQSDNDAMLAVIQECVREFGYYHSPYIVNAEEEREIWEHYQRPRCGIYVLEDADGTLLGGGGFAPVEGMEHLCEIMQVYFSPRVRGRGFGKRLVQRLMEEASATGYEGLYIETVPEMKAAIGLYASLGFAPLAERLGTGGHSVCSVFMQRPALDHKQRSA